MCWPLLDSLITHLAFSGGVTFLMFVSRFFLFKLQESPKFLVAKGRDEEAIKDEKAVYDDFPDGGLRAWTVVAPWQRVREKACCCQPVPGWTWRRQTRR